MGEPHLDSSSAPDSPRRRLLALAAGLVAVVFCALTLWATGATDAVALPGIPVPAAEVTWLVPALRLVADGAAVLTVGALLGAVVLVPGDHLLSAPGYRWMRMAGWGAAAWAAASLASLPVLLADFLGIATSAVSLRGLTGFVLSVVQGRVQLIVAVLVAVVALAARTVLTPAGARALLVVALVATVPPAFASHSASEADHGLAVTSVALHVLGVVLWAGGLLALMLVARLSGSVRSAAAERFSRLAAPMALLVAGSGVASSLTRLSAPDQILNSGYGIVLLAKTAALLALVAIGWWHRRCTLPALAAGHPAAFLRLAGVEVVLFAATVGLAVALSRAPLPLPTG